MNNIVQFPFIENNKISATEEITRALKKTTVKEQKKLLSITKSHLKSIGYIIKSTDKLLGKSEFPAEKTILLPDESIGFCLGKKKTFTNDHWVIYAINAQKYETHMDLVHFILKTLKNRKSNG